MSLEEKIKVLESVGCIRITTDFLKYIKKENKELYNSLMKTIYRRRLRTVKYILIYINGKEYMLYSKDYIEKNDVNKIKKKLKLWLRISKA